MHDNSMINDHSEQFYVHIASKKEADMQSWSERTWFGRTILHLNEKDRATYIHKGIDLVQSGQASEALMDKLTGVKNISQASYHILYVHNLIGPVLGLKRSVDFDIYTNVLSDQLVAKSREEVLDIFFQQLTPAVLVKELMIHINKLSAEEKDHLRFLLLRAYWDADAINSTGTIKVLQMLALLIN